MKKNGPRSVWAARWGEASLTDLLSHSNFPLCVSASLRENFRFPFFLRVLCELCAKFFTVSIPRLAKDGSPHQRSARRSDHTTSIPFRVATDATSASLPCPFHCPRSGFHGFQCFPRPRRSRTLRVHLRPFAVLPQFLTSYFIIHHSSLHSSPRSGILWILVDSRPSVVLSRSTQLVERPSWSFRFRNKTSWKLVLPVAKPIVFPESGGYGPCHTPPNPPSSSSPIPISLSASPRLCGKIFVFPFSFASFANFARNFSLFPSPGSPGTARPTSGPPGGRTHTSSIPFHVATAATSAPLPFPFHCPRSGFQWLSMPFQAAPERGPFASICVHSRFPPQLLPPNS